MDEHPVAYDVVMIGHFARDVIVDAGTRTRASGGAVYYGSVAVRRLGKTCAVVTRLARADARWLAELEAEGVRVYWQESAETSGIENVYTTADRNRRTCSPLGFAGPFRLEDVPRLAAHYVVLGPIIAGEFSLEFLQTIRSHVTGQVALDVQGFVRVREGPRLVFREWADQAEGLRHVDVLKADDAEVEALTGETDLEAGARALAAHGPSEVLVTRAEGLLVLAGDKVFHAPFQARSLVGRTGRGDTATATYLAWRIDHPPAEACRMAGLATSRKMEQPGPLQVPLEDLEQALEHYP